jgi:excisionase family DNA binding protein
MSLDAAIEAAVARAVAPLVAEVRALRTAVEAGRRFATVAEAAALLEVSTRTLRRWIRAGTIAVVRRGRCVRVDLASVKPTDVAAIAELAQEARGPTLRALSGGAG